MSIKFLLLGGGGVLGFGGRECRLYFYGREDFSENGFFLKASCETEMALFTR